MKNKTIELLAPAGSYETFMAVIAAGADAVYVGGSQFGARAFANNFQEDELLRAIDYAHICEKQLYLTVNTLLKEDELEENFYAYLKPYYEAGLDAVIVQDLGLMSFIKENFKDLPIHASTQMTITGVGGAKQLKAFGASRIVTARELSLQEIKVIHNQVPIEIESFVHGALCYCYSGQCLYSSMLGGRSGNRGRCAQPCRLPYEVLQDGKRISTEHNSYCLSPKDMCTIELIPQLIQAGVYSFKIEGRMKQAEYASGVTSLYRKYINSYLENPDKEFKVTKDDLNALLDYGNRSGFVSGYYNQRNGKNMITLSRPNYAKRNEQLLERTRNQYVNSEYKEKIKGILTLSKGLPAKMVVSGKGFKVQAYGTIVDTAQKQPLLKENVEKQMHQTGTTPFIFENLEIQMEEGVFVPVKELKQLRRNTLEELQACFLQSYKRTKSEHLFSKEQKEISREESIQKATKKKVNSIQHIHIYTETRKGLEIFTNKAEIKRIYMNCTAFSYPFDKKQLLEVVNLCRTHEKECYFVMPAIFRQSTVIEYEKQVLLLKEIPFDGYLIKNLESINFLKEHDFLGEFIVDHNLYSWSRRAEQFFNEELKASCVLPLELNDKELKQRGCQESELVVYGYLPLMQSVQCVQKSIASCNKKSNSLFLKDRYQKEFRVQNYCDYCYSTLYNSLPLHLLLQSKSVMELAPKSIRLEFTTESVDQIQLLINAYIHVFYYGQHEQTNTLLSDFTKGHFKRGVE